MLKGYGKVMKISPCTNSIGELYWLAEVQFKQRQLTAQGSSMNDAFNNLIDVLINVMKPL